MHSQKSEHFRITCHWYIQFEVGMDDERSLVEHLSFSMANAHDNL